jgi:fructokinase
MSFVIASYGEALWDLLPSGPVLGGAPLNLAYRANSLGNRGIIVSRLGRDEYGKKAHTQITASGMDDLCLQWDESAPTGTVEITLDENSEPDYYIVPDVAYDNIEYSSDLDAAVSKADCLCYGTLIQRSPKSRQTLAKLISSFSGRHLLLDINLRRNCYNRDTVKGSVERASILKLNEDEVAPVAGFLGFDLSGDKAPDFADFIKELFAESAVEYCLITLGEFGALGGSKEGEIVYSPGHKIDLVDPCGSGDAFTAAFIDSLLGGRSLEEALVRGNALGALVAGQAGATGPISMDDFEKTAKDSDNKSIRKDFLKYIV